MNDRTAAAQERVEAARARQRARPTPARLTTADMEDLDMGRGTTMDELSVARWAARIPSRFLWATTTDFRDSTRQELDHWARMPQGRNLCLFGPVGVGKSHAAVAACRHSHDVGLEVQFLPVVELLDLLRPGGPDHAFDTLVDVDRLIVDDLGTERPTEWTAERLFAVLNRRWLEERPTVITTNLAPDDLERAIGERLYSRLVGSGAVNLALSGKDRRRNR